MAVAMGTVMAVMTGVQLAGSLGSAVFSFFRSRKAAKQNKAMAKALAAQNAISMQQTQMMVNNLAVQSGTAAAGLNTGYMAANGFTQAGAGYGPAPAGYFPPGFA